MNTQVFGHKRNLIVVILAALLALPGIVSAQSHGGGGSGHGGGGGMHGGGFHGGGMHGGGSGFHGGSGAHGGSHGGSGLHDGFHGGRDFHNGAHGGSGFHDGFHDNHGFHDGVHGGPGFHDGFHGDRGFHDGVHGGHGFHDGFHRDFHGRPFFRPFVHNHIFFSGLAVGAFVTTLPLYYDTFWYGGVPYYYYGNTYLRWDDGVGQYQVVAPPAGAPVTEASAGDSNSGDLYAYPKNGQSEEQQKTDRYECHKWAVDQSGFDPIGGTVDAGKRDDYLRAEGACLEGRGYSVE